MQGSDSVEHSIFLIFVAFLDSVLYFSIETHRKFVHHLIFQHFKVFCSLHSIMHSIEFHRYVLRIDLCAYIQFFFGQIDQNVLVFVIVGTYGIDYLRGL